MTHTGQGGNVRYRGHSRWNRFMRSDPLRRTRQRNALFARLRTDFNGHHRTWNVGNENRKQCVLNLASKWNADRGFHVQLLERKREFVEFERKLSMPGELRVEFELEFPVVHAVRFLIHADD